MKNKRIWLIAFGSVLLPVPVIAQETGWLAQFSTLVDGGGGYWSVIDETYTQVLDYGTQLEGAIDSASGELNAVLDGEFGVLGLPDFEQLEAITQTQIMGSPATVLVPERQSQAAVAAAEVERGVREARIQATIGPEGQAAQYQSLQGVQQTVLEVAGLGQAAQFETSTQEVLKKTALQQAYTADLLGSVSAELHAARVDSALTQQSLVDLSRAMDRDDRRALVETTSQSNDLLLAAWFTDLRGSTAGEGE